MDNGPEFAGRALDEWAYHKGVKLNFIVTGHLKPATCGRLKSGQWQVVKR